MYLTDISLGQSAIIESINAGYLATKRLADLGLTLDKKVKLINYTLFKGPIEIEISGSKIVLGRGLASKITVK